MKRIDIYLVGVVLACIILFTKQCDTTPPVDNSELIKRIDSLKNNIRHRDTLIISRDTVINNVRNIKETIKEYYTTTDTVEKIVICDSLVKSCDSLASQYLQQDSIFRAQIYDYRTLVETQDSVITILKTDIDRAKRKGNIKAGISFAAGFVAGRASKR